MGKYLFLVFVSMPLYFIDDIQPLDHQEAYIKSYSDLAVREMERTGIPASIKLAQAILESNSGRSELAVKARNHFGIKCGSEWDGPTYSLKDDERNAAGDHIASCFRVYKEVRGSYKAHSDFLAHPDKTGRYGFLFRLPPTDYVGWARGLQRSGYATNPRYAELLIDIIRRHNLDQYDQLSPEARDHLAGLGSINDVRLAFAKPGETLEQIAQRTEVSVEKLIQYNEETYTGETPLVENSLVYLQPKRNFFRGKVRWHKVREGETFASIAQLYGVKTHKLRHKNRTPDRYEPFPGERLKLRGRVRKHQVPKTRPPLPAKENLPITEEVKVVIDDTHLAKPPAPPAQIETATPPPAPKTEEKPVYHTVTSGETLWRIAYRYNLTADQIKKLNNLTKDQINVGQKLRIK